MRAWDRPHDRGFGRPRGGGLGFGQLGVGGFLDGAVLLLCSGDLEALWEEAVEQPAWKRVKEVEEVQAGLKP